MTIDLEELRQKKAFEDLQAQNADVPEKVTTAFLVVQNLAGQWAAYSDYEDKNLGMQRKATMDDIVGGVENVKLGCLVQQTSFATMVTMEQRATQMQQQMRQQQEANHVASLIDPKKLRA